MSDANQSSKTPLFILGAIALSIAGIGMGAYFALGAKGEPVGNIVLTDSAPSLKFNLAKASTLSFRLDATLPAPTNENSSRATRNAVYDTLGESNLTVTDSYQGRAPRVAQCAAYDGRFVSASDTKTEVAVQGIPLKCTFTGAEPGEHTLTATVIWARGVTARSAVLEVRAEAP
ncbi:MAG: hypothetical protein IPK82_39505 [Polyangiaceae bacterium]|nr:hypothetical protein [Polyangiaceae bacterium]